jgi:hypothetical protein
VAKETTWSDHFWKWVTVRFRDRGEESVVTGYFFPSIYGLYVENNDGATQLQSDAILEVIPVAKEPEVGTELYYYGPGEFEFHEKAEQEYPNTSIEGVFARLRETGQAVWTPPSQADVLLTVMDLEEQLGTRIRATRSRGGVFLEVLDVVEMPEPELPIESD